MKYVDMCKLYRSSAQATPAATLLTATFTVTQPVRNASAADFASLASTNAFISAAICVLTGVHNVATINISNINTIGNRRLLSSASRVTINYDVMFTYASDPTVGVDFYYNELVQWLDRNITNEHFTLILNQYSDLMHGNLSAVIVSDIPITRLHTQIPSMEPSSEPVVVNKSNSSSNSGSSRNIIMPIAVSVSLCIFLICLSYFVYRSRKDKNPHDQQMRDMQLWMASKDGEIITTDLYNKENKNEDDSEEHSAINRLSQMISRNTFALLFSRTKTNSAQKKRDRDLELINDAPELFRDNPMRLSVPRSVEHNTDGDEKNTRSSVFNGDSGGLMTKRVASMRSPTTNSGDFSDSKISYSYLSNPMTNGSPKTANSDKAADVLMKETFMDNPAFSLRMKTVYSNPSSPHTSITFTDKSNGKRVTSAEFDAEYLAYSREENEDGLPVPRPLSIDVVNPAVLSIRKSAAISPSSLFKETASGDQDKSDDHGDVNSET